MSTGSLTDDFLRAMLENMVAEGALAKEHQLDIDARQVVAANIGHIMEIINVSVPLSRIVNSSDLVLHAEGPGVRTEAPRLSAFNWLSLVAEKALRNLSTGLFSLLELDANRLKRALDLRLTGMAPGSLYLGFCLAEPPQDLVSAKDEPVFERIRKSLRQLPRAASTIGDDDVSPEIREIIPDAAERDVTLGSLYMLSPTGRKGIHTVEVSSRSAPKVDLSQRERVVLKDALKNPDLANKKHGSFEGTIREIDLDAKRFQLRGVVGVGSLRCVYPGLDSTSGKGILDEIVRVEGEYEVDRNGRPRLMLVEHMRRS